MNTPETTPSAETYLLAELARVERSIGELENERATIKRMLTSIRENKIIRSEVTRKNSFGKIIVESRIIEFLKSSKRPQSSSVLFAEALEVSFGLKKNTFRSYLLRMKRRGVIFQAKNRIGYWTISPSN